jgi:hypothetical protein
VVTPGHGQARRQVLHHHVDIDAKLGGERHDRALCSDGARGEVSDGIVLLLRVVA